MQSELFVRLIRFFRMDDLQQFNTLMRSSYGKSPRQLRDQMPKEDESTWAIDRE